MSGTDQEGSAQTSGNVGAGPVAVVTGAARGIGAATVLALAGAGWSVLAVDSAADDPALPYPMATPAELSGVVGQAAERAGPGRVGSFIADVRDQGAVTAAVAEAERRWGGLDAAIAAAGVIAGGVPLWEVPLAQQQAVLDVGLGGVLALARAAVPALLRRPAPRSGRFLAVASAAATRGLRGPQAGGACGSCSAFGTCRGGCMAAKFFTGLPLDGPDPECVKGHGERALASAAAAAPAPSPDHSHRTAPDRREERRPVPLTLSRRPPVTACNANPLAGFVPE